MKQTAVEWLGLYIKGITTLNCDDIIEQAKAMEKKEKLKHSLFIGKVTEILGFDKTVELLKQCNDEII